MRTQLLPTLVAACLVFSACGGEDDSTDTTAMAVDAESTSTTAAVASTAPPTTATTTSEGSGFALSSDPWCAAAVDEDVLGAGVDLVSPTLEDDWADYLVRFDEARSDAPVEIREDVDLLYDFTVSFGEILAEYDWELLEVPAEEFDVSADEELAAAGSRIAEYCGVD